MTTTNTSCSTLTITHAGRTVAVDPTDHDLIAEVLHDWYPADVPTLLEDATTHIEGLLETGEPGHLHDPHLDLTIHTT